MKTDAGPVKVAALSVEALAEAGEPASISAGKDSSAAVEVDAGAQAGAFGTHFAGGKSGDCAHETYVICQFNSSYVGNMFSNCTSNLIETSG